MAIWKCSHLQKLFALALLLFAVKVADSQDVPGTYFDVVSIRPSKPSVESYSLHRISPATFTVTGMTVYELISFAYTLRNYQILNRPKWLDRERFDISAKDTVALESIGNDLTNEKLEELSALDSSRLQKLLASRFQLKSHQEKRVTPLHVLVVQTAGKLSAVPCSPNGGYYLETGLAKGPVPIKSLVAVLSHDLDGRIEDGTGLTGCFAMDLHWTQSAEFDESENVPSIATALSSLGLKLKPGTGTVDFLVIDSVEHPSSN